MLKSTGIVRKIDDLGRIVIPKEIRKVLKIGSGDDLEIYIENDLIVLKKYSIMLSNKVTSDKLVSSVDDLTDACIFITDKEKVITKGDLENKNLNNKLKDLITDRRSYTSEVLETIKFDDISKNGFFIIKPIIQNSSANGLIIIYKKDKLLKEDMLFASILKNIIENE